MCHTTFTNLFTKRGHTRPTPCTTKITHTHWPLLSICASFVCTHISSPCTHAIFHSHMHISCHMCQPCALHAPGKAGSPVYFYVSNHGTEALTFLPTPPPPASPFIIMRTFPHQPGEVFGIAMTVSCSQASPMQKCFLSLLPKGSCTAGEHPYQTPESLALHP